MNYTELKQFMSRIEPNFVGKTAISWVSGLIRFLFNILYHPLAFTYDFVAALVSGGLWKRWVLGTIPLLTGERILELGYGPGHLQKAMRENGLQSFGLDESRQMAAIAGRRLRLAGKPTILRAHTQKMPFADHSFDCIVSTFPSEYIFDPDTLSECSRVLRTDGKMVVLLTARIIAGGGWRRVVGWFSRIPFRLPGAFSVMGKITERFNACGFQASISWIPSLDSELMVVLARLEPGQNPADTSENSMA